MKDWKTWRYRTWFVIKCAIFYFLFLSVSTIRVSTPQFCIVLEAWGPSWLSVSIILRQEMKYCRNWRKMVHSLMIHSLKSITYSLHDWHYTFMTISCPIPPCFPHASVLHECTSPVSFTRSSKCSLRISPSILPSTTKREGSPSQVLNIRNGYRKCWESNSRVKNIYNC